MGHFFWLTLRGFYIPTFHHIYEVSWFWLFHTWTEDLESKVKRLKRLENLPELVLSKTDLQKIGQAD